MMELKAIDVIHYCKNSISCNLSHLYYDNILKYSLFPISKNSNYLPFGMENSYDGFFPQTFVVLLFIYYKLQLPSVLQFQSSYVLKTSN